MNSEPPPLVLHIIYALGTGGLENGLVHLINGTPANRYRHAIVCLTKAEAFAGRITAPDVEVHELGMQPGRDWAAYRRLWLLLRKMRPAIVHSRNLAALEAQLVTCLVPGIRRVHGEHGRDMNDLDGGNFKYRLLRKGMRFVVHRYTAVSRDLAGYLVRAIGVKPARLKQIYNGIDQARFYPRLSDDEGAEHFPDGFLPERDALIAGTVGRLAEVKNQRIILEAAAQALTASPALRERLRLVIVGEGVMRESLESLAQELGLKELLWMPGDRNDIPGLLRAMDVFLLPSLGEGISNTLLEAMATGLPVIASRVGGNPELVQERENGLLVPVGDRAALCDAMLELFESPERRRRMGANGAAFVTGNFSWTRTVLSYLEVYDDLLGNETTPSELGENRVE